MRIDGGDVLLLPSFLTGNFHPNKCPNFFPISSSPLGKRYQQQQQQEEWEEGEDESGTLFVPLFMGSHALVSHTSWEGVQDSTVGHWEFHPPRKEVITRLPPPMWVLGWLV